MHHKLPSTLAKPQRLTRRKRLVLGASALCLALTVVTALWWAHRFERYTPIEALKDLKAAAGVGKASSPVERFMELRYGLQTQPLNRQKAFLEFFNAGHIAGLYLITSHLAGAQKQTNINAMAQWLADYRQSLSTEEKAALRQALQAHGGADFVRQASRHYLQQDAYYRAATTRVIQELMATVATLQEP